MGKLATMLYALIGIPLMLYFLTTMGSLLADQIRRTYRSCCGYKSSSDQAKNNRPLRPMSVQRAPLHANRAAALQQGHLLDQTNASLDNNSTPSHCHLLDNKQQQVNCYLPSLETGHYHLQLLDPMTGQPTGDNSGQSNNDYVNEQLKLDPNQAAANAAHFCSLSRAENELISNGSNLTGDYGCSHAAAAAAAVAAAQQLNTYKYATLPTLLLTNQPNGQPSNDHSLVGYGNCCAQALVYNSAAGVYQPLSGEQLGPNINTQNPLNNQTTSGNGHSASVNVHSKMNSQTVASSGRCLHPEPPEQLLFTFESGQSIGRTTRVPLFLCALLLIAYLAAGACVLQYGGKRSWVDSVYDCFLVLSTIGGPGADGLLANLDQQLAANRSLLSTGRTLLASSTDGSTNIGSTAGVSSTNVGSSGALSSAGRSTGGSIRSNSGSTGQPVLTGSAFSSLLENSAAAAASASAGETSQRALLAFAAYLLCGMLLVATCLHLAQDHLLARMFGRCQMTQSLDDRSRSDKDLNTPDRYRTGELDEDFDL